MLALVSGTVAAPMLINTNGGQKSGVLILRLSLRRGWAVPFEDYFIRVLLKGHLWEDLEDLRIVPNDYLYVVGDLEFKGRSARIIARKIRFHDLIVELKETRKEGECPL